MNFFKNFFFLIERYEKNCNKKNMTEINTKKLLSGNEALAYAALHSHVALGCGYPGTPSTEILENFSLLGGKAQWAPNEKVALEVAIGASFSKSRAIATMKHVGLNVAADPFFTVAYTGTEGALVIVVADDPGMASSQNEQDNRHYALFANVPMIEPSDSQEVYSFFLEAVRISERWKIPILFRVTTRVCHSKSIADISETFPVIQSPAFQRDPKKRVMIPAYARLAHINVLKKIEEIQEWNETNSLNSIVKGKGKLGLICSGAVYMYCKEAAPEANILKLGLTNLLPYRLINSFIQSHETVYVIEEGEPFLQRLINAAGHKTQGKPDHLRNGELSVEKVRLILGKITTIPPALPPGKPPQLCNGCPHRTVFTILKKLNCIVSGDIGCYTLGVLPPFEAMDTCVCMGASIGVGLGMRHVLPPEEQKKVVSIIGDGTFMHSGLTGLLEMVYNPPSSGHVLIILDNQTTAMTGLQEHPGTGRKLNQDPSIKIYPEEIAKALRIPNIHVLDPVKETTHLEELILSSLSKPELTVIVARRSCLLAAKKNKQNENSAQGKE